MQQESQSKTWIVLIVAIISGTAVICAAIIGLGAPFAERMADRFMPPSTPTTTYPLATATETLATVNPRVGNQPTVTANPPAPRVDCSQMIEGEHHSPTLGVEWKFESISENRIIHIWSNHWENNLPEFKFFLPAGQSISFMSGGGSVWIERENCNGVAQVIYQRDTFREISLDGYQKYIEQKIIP